MASNPENLQLENEVTGDSKIGYNEELGKKGSIPLAFCNPLGFQVSGSDKMHLRSTIEIFEN